MFDDTPIFDADCIDKDAILIVERDASKVIVPVAEVPVMEILAEEKFAAGVLAKDTSVVVPIKKVTVPVKELPLTTVPLVEVMGLIGLMTEDPVPDKPPGELVSCLW